MLPSLLYPECSKRFLYCVMLYYCIFIVSGVINADLVVRDRPCTILAFLLLAVILCMIIPGRILLLIYLIWFNMKNVGIFAERRGGAWFKLCVHLYILQFFLHFYIPRYRWTTRNRFYRASICEGGLGNRNSVRPSVRLSVCLSHACIVTKLNDALQIFLYHTKGQSLCYSDTKSGWSATPPSLWNLRSKWPTPLRKTPTSTDFRS